MHESCEVIAVSFDRPKLVDDEVVAPNAPSIVLTVQAHGEHFEPDAVQIDAGDVLPGDDCHEVATVLDHAEHSALERRSRQVVHPADRITAYPLLDFVFVWSSGGAAKGSDARGIGGRVISTEVHRAEASASFSRSRSARVRM